MQKLPILFYLLSACRYCPAKLQKLGSDKARGDKKDTGMDRVSLQLPFPSAKSALFITSTRQPTRFSEQLMKQKRVLQPVPYIEEMRIIVKPSLTLRPDHDDCISPG